AAPHSAERRVAELPLLTRAEEERLAIVSKGPAKPLSDATYHRLFEAQVLRTPDARAIEDEAIAYTYRELSERANRIAHALHECGVRRGARVGISVARSADMVVAVLGVLKANAAYVPLDPSYPSARLAFMAEDADLAALVTCEGSLESLPLPE